MAQCQEVIRERIIEKFYPLLAVKRDPRNCAESTSKSFNVRDPSINEPHFTELTRTSYMQTLIYEVMSSSLPRVRDTQSGFAACALAAALRFQKKK